MSSLQSLAYILVALAFLLLVAGLNRWWWRRKALRYYGGPSHSLAALSRRPKIKWPGKRAYSGASQGPRSHFPHCPSCDTPSQPSPLEGRFECPHCGRLFS